MSQTIKIIFFLFIFTIISFGQVTGLSGWNIFVDPGHSGDENMGIYGYSEARKNLRVGLRLQELLMNTTDIDTVYMSRTNDQQTVSLSQRTSRANNLGSSLVSFYSQRCRISQFEQHIVDVWWLEIKWCNSRKNTTWW